MRLLIPVLVFAQLVFAIPAEARQKPATDIFGIRLGMAELEARKKLEKIGTRESDAASLKQSWRLKDRKFGYLAIRYNDEWKVRWISVFAAEKGKKVRYSDIGPLDKARLQGRYIYTWEVPGADEASGVLVTARGSDPKTLFGLSISSLRVIREVEAPGELPDTMYLSKP